MRSDLRGMSTADVVIVNEDRDLGISEVDVKLPAPLFSTAGVGGRDPSLSPERFTIAFALSYQDVPAGLDGLDYLGQPVQHSLVAGEVPNPPADTIGPALPEVLGKYFTVSLTSSPFSST